MEGNTRISATVISSFGRVANKDDFYFNGSFANCHNTQSIQCSFDKAANNFVFAVSDSMGLEEQESSSISVIREIKKFHESSKLQQFSLESLTERVYEAVQLSSNLIYSKSVVDKQDSSVLTGFSSFIIDNNRATIMNLGNNGVFLFRHGQSKEIFTRNGGRKSEKLKQLGINPAKPDIYNDTEQLLKMAEEESKTKVKLSPNLDLEEGDIIVLCSDGFLNNVSRNKLETVADLGLDSSKMAGVLYQEAIKNGLEEDITVMVIQVEEIRNLLQKMDGRRLYPMGYNSDKEDEDVENDEPAGKSIVNYVLGFVCVLVISGVLFMGYLIMQNSGLLGSSPSTDTAQTTDSTISQSTNSAVDPSTDTAADSTVAETTPGDSTVSQQSDSNPDTDKDTDAAGDNPNNPGTDVNVDNNNQPDNNQSADSDFEIYVVKQGDTLGNISQKYYGTMTKYKDIMKDNNITKENSLYIGQKLKIRKVE